MTPAVLALEKAGIDHVPAPYDHDPGAESYGLEAADALGLDPATVFKTLMVTLDGGPLAVCVVPVTHQLSLKAAARALGAKKATMADVEQAQRATGYLVGGISPLGQKKRHATAVDATALDHAQVWVSGGKRGLDVGLAPTDLIALTGAVTADLRA